LIYALGWKVISHPNLHHSWGFPRQRVGAVKAGKRQADFAYLYEVLKKV
jgi:hypothetical protein